MHSVWLVVLSLIALVFSVSPVQAATLESPARGATLSGIGFISGWKCSAQNITVRIDAGSPLSVAMRQPRADTRSACGGATNNGFILQMNWALLGDGTHTVAAYDNGVKFASATFDVTTFDQEVVKGAEGDFALRNFPRHGETSYFEWNESTQHMELVDFASGSTPPPPPEPEPPAQTGLRAMLGSWRFTHSRGSHTWTLNQTAVSSSTGKTYAHGRAEGQYLIVGLWDPTYDLEYSVLWETASSCEFYLFTLTTSTTAEGEYLPTALRGGECGSIGSRYPTRGVRTAAPRALSKLNTPLDGSATLSVDALAEQLDRLIEEMR